MKIAILSKADASGGGASRVAEKLCYLLNANGHITHHYVAFKQPDNIAVRSLYGNFNTARIVRRLNYYVKKVGLPELIPWELFFLHLSSVNQYDLLHFHDISSAISPLTVRYLARKIPTVWTFHDCSPFTGGCLYPMDCTRYQTRCGQCPQLGQWPIDTKFDFTGFMQDTKRGIAAEGNVVPITPSIWMAQIVQNSGLYTNPPYVIPNGIDINLFHPQDPAVLRQKLGLSTEQPIILIAAAYINEARKGVKFAIETVRQVQHLTPLLVVLGHLDDQSKEAFTGIDMISTGYITDDQLKAQYMAAADLFLSTSLAESFSLVTLETMATATPAISFASGGITDLIEHNHTGYLVPPKDVDGLVAGLKLALTNNRAAEWGRNARQRAEMLYSQETFLENHLSLYEQVIRDFKPQ